MDYAGARDYIIHRFENELSPNLYFHNLNHTLEVVQSANLLIEMEKVPEHTAQLIRTAALYHDAGIIDRYKDHEMASVEIIRQILPSFGYKPSELKQVADLILVTSLPQKALTLPEKIICDADLDSLGRDDFFIYSFRLQLELRLYGILNSTLTEWFEFELNFLNKHQYFTASAFKLRQAKKLENIRAIEELLKINSNQ